MGADTVTILHCGPKFRATKLQTWRPETKWTTLDYDAGYLFRFTEHPVNDVFELGALIERHRGDPKAMIVRGEPSEAARAPGAWLQRKLSGPSTPGTLTDVPRHALLTDIDKFPCKLLELIDDPEAVVRRAIETMLPAEFQDATCFYQFSSSAGFRGGRAGIHLWWWLSDAYDSRTIKRWLEAKTKATQNGECKVDCSILSGNIPHFIADPVIVGGHDPLPRRTGFIEGEADEVVIRNIEVAPQPRPINIKWSGPAQLKRQHDKLRSALEFVPNDDVKRDDWIRIGHAIKAALGEDGRDLWLEWSHSSSKTGTSGKSDTAERKWDGFAPSLITAATIFYLAREVGWEWDDSAIPADHRLPAYHPAPTEPRDDAIKRQNDAIADTIRTATARGVLRRAKAAKRQEAIEACADWDELSPRQKARIVSAARREALREAGVTRIPATPRTLVTGAQGTGKTATAAATAAAIRGSVVALALQPSLEKAEEFVDTYNEIAGPDSLPAMAVRGRGAKMSPTELMCPRNHVVNAAVAKGVNARKSICSKCPLRPIPLVQKGCGYLQQEAKIDAMGDRGLFVASAKYLHLPMPGPKPDILVIDEDVTMGAVDIMEMAPGQIKHVPFRGHGLDEIMKADRVIDHVKAALATPEPLTTLRAAGVDADTFRETLRVAGGRRSTSTSARATASTAPCPTRNSYARSRRYHPTTSGKP